MQDSLLSIAEQWDKLAVMNPPRTKNFQSLTLNSASFIAQFAISMVNLALVYHLRATFSFSPRLVGLAASTYTFSYFVFCVLLGRFCANFKPRHCVEVAVLGMAASIVSILLSNQIWQVFAALTCYGFFMSLLWPQVMSWLSRGKERHELNKATSSFNFSWSIGAALSPLVAGLLVENSTRIPLVVSSILMVVIFFQIFIATMLVPSIRAATSEAQDNREAPKEDRSTPLRFLCWAGILTVYMALSVFQTIFPMHAQDGLSLSESSVGFLLLLRGLATCLTFVLLGIQSWWQFKRPVVIMSQLAVAAVCMAGSWFAVDTPYAAYIALMTVFGVLFAIVYTLSIFHGASGSTNRSQRMLIHEILLTIGSIVGSFAGAFVYERFGYARVLAWCALVVAVPVVVAVLRRPRRRLAAVDQLDRFR